MPVFQPFVGMPGVSVEKIAKQRVVAADGYPSFLPSGKVVNGAKTRDPDNTDPTRMRAGLLMGPITATGLLANSVIGRSTGALANGGTTLALSAAQATELVRRVGATGTFKLTGPPAASGVVRSVTAAYSAVNTSTGDVTITAPSVNEVQTLTFGAAATGGTMRLRVPKADGTMVTTDAITWNATDATWLAAINTALDGATGVVGGIVATGAAPDTALTFTFSGTGYAALPQPTEMISVIAFPTSATTATVVRTTTGVDGRFVAGSLVGDTDGSHVPTTFLPCGWEMINPADGTDFPLGQVPIGGNVDASMLLPWPSDASLKTWVRDQLNALGQYVFTERF